MENKLNFLVTGDLHARWDRLLFLKDLPDDSTAIIVLGDLGADFFCDKMERSRKDTLNSFHNYIYAIRGNHDKRPEDVEDYKLIYDENVKGEVYCCEKRWPYIRFFQDGKVYEINGHSALCIGGAYSVDKDFRVMFGHPWFANEQLSNKEMADILNSVNGKSFDFVFTHTCPISWEPRDLFLPSIDQRRVDKTMENFLEDVKKAIKFKVWLFGHYHDDRIVRKGVELFYKDVQELEEVFNRWQQKELPKYILTWNFDPNYNKKR